MISITEIFIAAENWVEGEWNYEDDNTDVIVTSNDNKRYVATFFTYQNIESLRKKNNKTGECYNGKYFWASDMILIEECSRKSIENIIEHLIKEDEFYQTFREIKADNK